MIEYCNLYVIYVILLNVPVLIVQHVTFLVYVFVMAVWRNGTETRDRNQTVSQVVPAQFARWAPNSCPSWDRPNLSTVKRWCNIQYTDCFWKSLICLFFSSLSQVRVCSSAMVWLGKTDRSEHECSGCGSLRLRPFWHTSTNNTPVLRNSYSLHHYFVLLL